MQQELGITLSTFDSLCPLIKAGWKSKKSGERNLLIYDTADPFGFSQAQAGMATVCIGCRHVHIESSSKNFPKGQCSPFLAENTQDGKPQIEFILSK